MFQLKTNLLPKDGTAQYVPQFLDVTEASLFYHLLLEEVDWQQYDIRIFGKKLAQPRLTAWYGDKAYSYSGIRLEAKAFSKSLFDLKQRIEAHCLAEFNSVLLNLYRHEKDGMGWHADDEKELGLNPVIASLSLGTERVFEIKHKTDRGLKYKLPLQSGSLLVLRDTMQHHWLHAVPKSTRPCGARINLTFRKIL